MKLRELGPCKRSRCQLPMNPRLISWIPLSHFHFNYGATFIHTLYCHTTRPKYYW
ncbi:hypothetical protein BDQ17DRAFT_1341166 [Cyathus striatus]|nr:hypothetical protein BDQ17DRAFT_1341166 [Cyathus striatus]